MARLTFLLLLLWVGVTVSRVVDLQKRIYGGADCSVPHHVALSESETGDDIQCGGSLIHPQWILTAGHCCSSIYAFVGADAVPGKPVIIQEKHIYKNHDIMLLKIPSQTLGPKIKLIHLPDDVECNTKPEKPKKGEVIQVTGHGLYQIDKSTGEAELDRPKNLQCATMHVADCNMNEIRTYRPNEPPEYWLCAKEKDADICQFDSGGGVVYNGKLQGVIIGSHDIVCKENADFLNVCKYNQWIKDTIK